MIKANQIRAKIVYHGIDGNEYLVVVGNFVDILNVGYYYDDHYLYFDMGSMWGIDYNRKFLKPESALRYAKECIAKTVNEIVELN